MSEHKYVIYLNDDVIARGLDLNTAAILTKALFQEYYLDRLMVVKIERED